MYATDKRVAELEGDVEALKEALANQEETIREQEKDIVTLKLQVAGIHERLVNCVTEAVSTVPTSVSTGGN